MKNYTQAEKDLFWFAHHWSCLRITNDLIANTKPPLSAKRLAAFQARAVKHMEYLDRFTSNAFGDDSEWSPPPIGDTFLPAFLLGQRSTMDCEYCASTDGSCTPGTMRMVCDSCEGELDDE